MQTSLNKRILLPLLASIVAITPLAIDLYLPAMLQIAVAKQQRANGLTGIDQPVIQLPLRSFWQILRAWRWHQRQVQLLTNAKLENFKKPKILFVATEVTFQYIEHSRDAFGAANA